MAAVVQPAPAGAAEPPPVPAPAPAPAHTLAFALEGPMPVTGGEARARLTVVPSGTWVLKATTPMHLQVTPRGGLSLPRQTFTAADWAAASGAGRSVVVPLAAEHPGEAGLEADISFFLCSEAVCRRFTDRARLAVVVAPPAPPSPAP